MNIAFCYESVLPTRGGCETYIADLSRRLVADGHDVHLYASRWDAELLPATITYHKLPSSGNPRFLRPWRFSKSCLNAMVGQHHDVTVGFDKTWGQDVLYPLGGLHVATVDHNRNRFASRWLRAGARALKWFDMTNWSYKLLERKQYFSERRPLIVVNSALVRDHFQHYYAVSTQDLRVVHNAIDPNRFLQHDRLRLRQEDRSRWGLSPTEIVGLFVAKNYRLKGLPPLLKGIERLVKSPEYQTAPPRLTILVCGNDDNRAFRRQVQKLGIERFVHFVGNHPDIRGAYFAADFLVHPTFYDPCSLVVLEALACDLPVITTRYNGASELMTTQQEGVVIGDPHDADQLADALSAMLDPARRRGFAQAARRAAAAWTFDSHYEAMLNVFEEAALRKQAA